MRLHARLSLAMAALLALSGCWTGQTWFAASDSVAVIADGRYRLAEAGGPAGAGDRISVTRQRDNSLLLEGAEHPWRAIIVPLGATQKDRYVVQLEEIAPHRQGHALFVLLDARGKAYRIAVLNCAGAAQMAVRQSGGTVSSDPQSGASCIFGDRATLLSQLRGVADAAPAIDLELVRE